MGTISCSSNAPQRRHPSTAFLVYLEWGRISSIRNCTTACKFESVPLQVWSQRFLPGWLRWQHIRNTKASENYKACHLFYSFRLIAIPVNQVKFSQGLGRHTATRLVNVSFLVHRMESRDDLHALPLTILTLSRTASKRTYHCLYWLGNTIQRHTAVGWLRELHCIFLLKDWASSEKKWK